MIENCPPKANLLVQDQYATGNDHPSLIELMRFSPGALVGALVIMFLYIKIVSEIIIW